jgi:hypothetical protein
MHRNLYFDDWDFVTDGSANFVVFGCFRSHFGSYFDPIAPPYTLSGVEDGELDP